VRIAIIGGGASGMATAYYLSKAEHHVTVMEKQSMLGGHIRTVNQNLQNNKIDPKLILEGGVIEFSSEFDNFLNLMKELDIELESIKIGTSIFKQDGERYLSRLMIQRNSAGLKRLIEWTKLAAVYLSAVGLWLRTYFKKTPQLHDVSLSKFVEKGQVRSDWIKLLMMYCYSIPFDLVNQIPAELAIPTLRRYMWGDWKRVVGGVYSYIDRISDRINGEIMLNALITGIRRNKSGVEVILGDGRSVSFDKLVFAVPPDQVLALLSDPGENELKYFGPWKKNRANTIIHQDPLSYRRFDIKVPSEFDFFQSSEGWGYNVCLNQLCGLPPEPKYFLAYNLETLIARENVLQTIEHDTPLYTVESLRYRDDIIRCNGSNHTYHVGAYLYDGLHEGAISSALRVAELVENEPKSVNSTDREVQCGE
jgi:predicted NAD/FAD-binding protein